jgi:hypothetical protein
MFEISFSLPQQRTKKNKSGKKGRKETAADAPKVLYENKNSVCSDELSAVTSGRFIYPDKVRARLKLADIEMNKLFSGADLLKSGYLICQRSLLS